MILITAAIVLGAQGSDLKRNGIQISAIEDGVDHQPVEKEQESDPYQKRFHEKALAEASRGPRSSRERTRPKETPSRAQDKSRELSELLPLQFIVLDLETTGLSPTANEIIEIGAIKIALEMGEHPGFQTFVKPTKPVPNNITKMTGITQGMVEEQGIELLSALQQLIEFVGNLPIVTYNAEFDMAFLWAAAKRCNLVLPNHYSCALKRARRAFPGFPSHRLSYMAEQFNLPGGDQHRAIGDCRRAAQVFLMSTVALNQKVRWTAPSTVDS
ncbi:MAG TPA: 3'-5' exonuclease [Terracidiphilus sp.]|nr:3'-5' exonuclease [Terracidiphilus sp.]